MAVARGFHELDVYQRSLAAAQCVYELSERLRAPPRLAWTDPVRRASRSVCARIAEGWQQRHCPSMFVRTLSRACHNAAETQVWLDLGHDRGWVSGAEHQKLHRQYRHLHLRLQRMMADADIWCCGGRPACRTE